MTRSKLFLSYRRADAEAWAVGFDSALQRRYGRGQVFLDHGTIPPGADFDAVISSHVRTANVMLAVIGPGWLDARHGDGARRLDDEHDFVRREIEMAIGREALVVPVLARIVQ